MPDPRPADGSSLVEALIASADPQLWARYCRLAAELDGGSAAADPVYAAGSVEWQRQQDQQSPRAEAALPAETEQAGRRRLSRRGAALPFAGAPSPLGAAGGAAFDAFLASRRGSPTLLAQIDAIENEMVAGFEAAGRRGAFRASGFRDGGSSEVMPDWFGQMQIDFARNAVVLPDGSEISGIEVATAPPAARSAAARGRPAQAMLRQTLVTLWERGAFTAGTGNERVLALVLRELGLSPSDPPYGFKSAETVRKLRKALKMSL